MLTYSSGAASPLKVTAEFPSEVGSKPPLSYWAVIGGVLRETGETGGDRDSLT